MPSLPKLSPHHSKAIILGVIVIILIIAQPFLWQYVKKRANELQGKKSQEEQIKGVNERAEGLSQALIEQRDDLNQLAAVVIPAEQVTHVVEQIEKIADDMNVNVTISSITEPSQSTSSSETVEKFGGSSLALSQVILTLQLYGPIDPLLQYLDQLEHLPEFTIIPTWSLTKGSVPATAVPTPTASPALIVPNAPSFSLNLSIIFFVRN